ncbi:O-acetyl-ADP-ribose deacetylase [Niabella yanshanensis]|uniref:O-acetyl-ADP-ribose deacetylase n=1 Tax=Niabella yanshanensis TaxID=577386 RepID=A0ABZ0W0S5_9BACT|nr:O-acetyl-ADP-ribose deacetylase [Niabella yanshanensis]WQD36860.1 O-acetyl-ADP-ribose deacetylase [Niabella yanshanensis]
MIELIKGDITKIAVDAIVNAANSSLLGGGGVDGAIHRDGGPAILEDCRKIRARQGGCKTGEAVITTAGNLPAQYVIHTVGPVWQNGQQGEKELLRQAYYNSLKLAAKNNVLSISFPNISTGIYGFPKGQAASIAIQTVREFITKQAIIQRVIFVCFDEENHAVYQPILEE